jgi:hypothetical protein
MTPDDVRNYWDGLVSGAPTPDAGLDPELAATIREFHALDDAPAPDPSLMSSVWQELVGEPLVTAPLEPLRIETPAVNGRRTHGAGRYETAVVTMEPSVRRRRLNVFLRADRLLAIGVLAGFGAGFIGGIGARLAMRVSGLLTEPANRRLLTENGNVVGEITLAGTLSIAMFAGMVGVFGGLLYVGIRSRLPGTGWRRGLVYGGLLLATFGFIVMDKDNPDYQLFGPPGVNVGTFSLVYVLFGLVVAPLADWLDRRLPGWPPVRPLRLRAVAGYALLAPFGLVGLLVVTGAALGAGGMTGLIFGVSIVVSAVSPLGAWLVRATRLPRPAFAGYLVLAAPSLIGLVLTVRAIAGILGAG